MNSKRYKRANRGQRLAGMGHGGKRGKRKQKRSKRQSSRWDYEESVNSSKLMAKRSVKDDKGVRNG
jgi:hypothetical protein